MSMNKSAGTRSFPRIDLKPTAVAEPTASASASTVLGGAVKDGEKMEVVAEKPTLPPAVGVMERAEMNMDTRNIKQQEDEELSAPKTFMVTVANTERLAILKRQIGTPHNWAINEALKLWFAQKYPDIVVNPTYKKKI